MAKKPFAWDIETEIGTVEVSEKERRVVKTCLLNKKAFVAVQKEIFIKEEWKIVANATFPVESFEKIIEIFNASRKDEK